MHGLCLVSVFLFCLLVCVRFSFWVCPWWFLWGRSLSRIFFSFGMLVFCRLRFSFCVGFRAKLTNLLVFLFGLVRGLHGIWHISLLALSESCGVASFSFCSSYGPYPHFSARQFFRENTGFNIPPLLGSKYVSVSTWREGIRYTYMPAFFLYLCGKYVENEGYE